MLLVHRNKGLEVEIAHKEDADIPGWAEAALQVARADQLALRVCSSGEVSLAEAHNFVGHEPLYVSPERYAEIKKERTERLERDLERSRAENFALRARLKRASAEHLVDLGMLSASGG